MAHLCLMKCFIFKLEISATTYEAGCALDLQRGIINSKYHAFCFSFLDEFLKPGNNGIGILVKLLKSIQIMGSQQSGSSNLSQLKSYKRTLVSFHLAFVYYTKKGHFFF